MADPVPSLAYQPQLHSHRRKLMVRWLILAALLAIAGAYWLDGPSIYRWMLRKYWTNQVEHYTAPSTIENITPKRVTGLSPPRILSCGQVTWPLEQKNAP